MRPVRKTRSAAAPAVSVPASERARASLRFALLLLGGAALSAVFLDFRLWPLAWIALVPLFFYSPRAASVRSAAFAGWAFGLAANVPAFAWLVETIHRFGGFPLAIALFFYAALSAYSAAQFAIVAAALRWAGPRAPLLLAPALWSAVEFLYPNLFPWRLGHSQRDLTWLIQIGDLTGPYGLGFVIAWFAAALARPPLAARRLAPPLVATLALVAYGAWRSHAVESILAGAPRVAVGIVQGNLALDEKRHAEHYEINVARYRRLSLALAPVPDFFVWPETVVEWGIPRDRELERARDPFPDAPAPLVFGAVSYRRDPRGEPEWFNSAFVRSTEGRLTGRYDKIVLMPFGEFIPFATWFPSLKDLSPNTGDFHAGDGPAVLAVSPTVRVGALICYEDLLAGHVRATVAAGATVLATLANDAWFGTSAALVQHETLALWRAIENRRYLVRATNTGLTSVIDPLGRRVASLPVAVDAATTVEVRPLAATSPYTAVGDAFGWLVLALALGLLIYARAPRNLASLHGVAPPIETER